MKKIVITSTILMSLIWFSLTSLMNSVKADEYNTAVIANVVTQTIQGNNVQTQKLMEQELERIGHQYAIQMISVFQQYLPVILEGALTDMRLKADTALVNGEPVSTKDITEDAQKGSWWSKQKKGTKIAIIGGGALAIGLGVFAFIKSRNKK